MGLINTSLDNHVKSLSNLVYYQNCQHSLKCNDFKKCKECTDDAMEWCKNVKECKKLSDYCKKCKKIYESCDFYLEYEKVMKNMYFMSECLECGKRRHL